MRPAALDSDYTSQSPALHWSLSRFDLQEFNIWVILTFLKRILLFAEIFGVKNVHLNQEIPQDISFSTGKFDNIKKEFATYLDL